MTLANPPVLPILRRVRTTQPQTAASSRINWSNPLTRKLAVFYTASGYSRAATGQFLNNYSALSSSSFKVTRSFSYYNTHGNPAAAISIPFNTAATEITYLIECNEYGSDVGHMLGNCSPNYGINNGVSILRGTNTSAVMTTVGGAITTATGLARQLNVWKTLTVRVRWNGANYTLSLFENGIETANASGGFTPYLYNAIGICTTMADFYSGTSNMSVRSVAAWNRALSDTEIKSLSDNPWQIYEPDTLLLAPPSTWVQSSQPKTFDYELSDTNPLAKGVKFAWVPATDTMLRVGSGVKAQDTVGDYVTCALGTAYQYKSIQSISAGECTVTVLADLTTPNNASAAIFAFGNSANNLPLNMIWQGGVSNTIEYYTRNDAGSSNYIASTPNTSTQPILIMGTRSDTSQEQKIYLDGVLKTTTPVPIAIGTNTFDRVGFGICPRLGMDLGWAGKVRLAIVHDRALSASEIVNLASNPWQIFKSKSASIAAHEVVTPRKSYMLGGTSPAPSSAAIIHIPRKTRTTQPQANARIDWGNSVTRNLNAAINMAEFKDAVTGTLLRSRTDYATNILKCPTPYGTGLADVNFAGSGTAYGRNNPAFATTGSLALFASFWLKNGSVATTTKVQLVNTDAGTAWSSGSGTNQCMVYWSNVGGVQTLNGRACWGTPYELNVDVTGIANGFHTVAFVLIQGGSYLVLDGKIIGSTTTANNNYYSITVALAGYEGPTFYTGGIGSLLLKGSYFGDITSAQMISLTKNPWQIFLPDNQPIWGPA